MFRFWKAIVSSVQKGFGDVRSDGDGCVELAYEDLSKSIPSFHPEQLMKDEGIDGRYYFSGELKGRFIVM